MVQLRIGRVEQVQSYTGELRSSLQVPSHLFIHFLNYLFPTFFKVFRLLIAMNAYKTRLLNKNRIKHLKRGKGR